VFSSTGKYPDDDVDNIDVDGRSDDDG